MAEEGYRQPTPVQAQAIPAVLAGGDVLAGAQTGTGKTASFALPVMQRLAAHPATKRKLRALVLVPTHELAAQVEESFRTYGRYLKLASTTVFGGVNINPQIQALRRGVDILVATPGRLLDHLRGRTVDLSGIEILVLDEADRMLDMGFIHDIRRVLQALPNRRQNLFFSATFAAEIRQLLLKPEPAIYKHLVDTTGIVPSESVFIDDLTRNVIAARESGLHAIQFTSPDACRAELRAMLPDIPL